MKTSPRWLAKVICSNDLWFLSRNMHALVLEAPLKSQDRGSNWNGTGVLLTSHLSIFTERLLGDRWHRASFFFSRWSGSYIPMVQKTKKRLEDYIFPRLHLNRGIHRSKCIALNNHWHICLLHDRMNNWQEKPPSSISEAPALSGLGAHSTGSCTDSYERLLFVRHFIGP